MRTPNTQRSTITRRKFLETTTAVAAFAIIPLRYKYINNKQTNISNFGGVQIGTISYSYRTMPAYGPEELLKYCIDSGIGSLEARWIEIEEYAGIPEGPQRRPLPQNFRGTEQDQRAFEAAQDEAREAQRKWRISVPMTKFEELRHMYNDAGVILHLAKMRPSNWSDEEIDYSFRVAKALGSVGVGEEIGKEACRRMAPFAEKHNLYAYFHNHGQVGTPGFEFDHYLDISPSIMLNFDVGHWYGATGIHPNEVLKKYHDRIVSVHLKDKTGPGSTPPDTNMPWGQGETPLADVLRLIQEEGWPIYCDIESEYPIPEGSNAVKEIKKCVDYCRQVLL